MKFLNNNVLNQVLMLFLMLLVGIYASKMKYIDKKMNAGLSNLLLKITLPLLIINSFITMKFSKSVLNVGEDILLYTLIIHIVLVLFSKFAYMKVNDAQKGISKFVTVFSNSGFMGYPVLRSIYGENGVFYCAIFGIILNLFMFSYGIMALKNTKGNSLKELKRAAVNPSIIATVIGFFIFILKIKLPHLIALSINSVGSMTSPLSMIIVGIMLADINLSDLFKDKLVYILTIVKLLIVPAITFVVLKLLNANQTVIGVIVVLEAMPAASNAAVMSLQYGSDENVALKHIFITTVLSIIIIPLVIKLVV
ncbi:AEC family transporter [Clostridium acetobutylicum]|uniref:AEC family transporter n=1 Tax=Clostridium acetobutylicum TaxID=1488 RepID=UPI001F60D004|nr:AEC family transporter [Clostridium acetobutylicum]